MRTTWTRKNPGTPPWKVGIRSPLRNIPGGENWLRIRIDPAHTYAIQGWGSTLATSSMILLAHLGFANGRTINRRLENLFMSFKTWCRNNGKTTSLHGLSLTKMKMTSMPDLNMQSSRSKITYNLKGAKRFLKGIWWLRGTVKGIGTVL